MGTILITVGGVTGGGGSSTPSTIVPGAAFYVIHDGSDAPANNDGTTPVAYTATFGVLTCGLDYAIANTSSGQTIAMFPSNSVRGAGQSQSYGHRDMTSSCSGKIFTSAYARTAVTNHTYGVPGRSTMCPPANPTSALALGMAQCDGWRVNGGSNFTLDNLYFQASVWPGGVLDGVINRAGVAANGFTIQNCLIRHGRSQGYAYANPNDISSGLVPTIADNDYTPHQSYDFTTSFPEYSSPTGTRAILMYGIAIGVMTGGPYVIQSNTFMDLTGSLYLNYSQDTGDITIRDNITINCWSHKMDFNWDKSLNVNRAPTSLYIGFNNTIGELSSSGANQVTLSCSGTNGSPILTVADSSSVPMGLWALDKDGGNAGAGDPNYNSNLYAALNIPGAGTWLPGSASTGFGCPEVISKTPTTITLNGNVSNGGGTHTFHVTFTGDTWASHNEWMQIDNTAPNYINCTTNGTNTITAIAVNGSGGMSAQMQTNLNAGIRYVMHSVVPGTIPDGTYLTHATSSTQATMSVAATGSASETNITIAPLMDWNNITIEGNIYNIGASHLVSNGLLGASDAAGWLYGEVTGVPFAPQGTFGTKFRGNVVLNTEDFGVELNITSNCLFWGNTLVRYDYLNTTYNGGIAGSPLMFYQLQQGQSGLPTSSIQTDQGFTLAGKNLVEQSSPSYNVFPPIGTITTVTADTHSTNSITNISSALSSQIQTDIANAIPYAIANNNWNLTGDIPRGATIGSTSGGGTSLLLSSPVVATGTTVGATYIIYKLDDVVLGAQGAKIPYTTAFTGPLVAGGAGYDLGTVLATFVPKAPYTGYGAIGPTLSTGYVNFVSMTIDTTQEPTLSLFNALTNQATSTVITSNVSVIRGGPASMTATLTGTGASKQMQVTTDFAGTTVANNGAGPLSWAAGPFVVNEGQYIAVRLTSSGSGGTTTTAIVTYTGTGLGGSATFSVKTT